MALITHCQTNYPNKRYVSCQRCGNVRNSIWLSLRQTSVYANKPGTMEVQCSQIWNFIRNYQTWYPFHKPVKPGHSTGLERGLLCLLQVAVWVVFHFLPCRLLDRNFVHTNQTAYNSSQFQFEELQAPAKKHRIEISSTFSCIRKKISRILSNLQIHVLLTSWFFFFF